MKQHAIPAAVAAVIAAGTAGGIEATRTAPVIPAPIVHAINASKHAWPDLSEAEKIALANTLAWLKGGKVIILCDGADCRDLQTDIDDAMEDAGVVSTRDRPMVPLGYGIAVVSGPGDGRAPRLAAALKAATGGRLDPKTEAHDSAKDVLIVAIGKRPRR